MIGLGTRSKPTGDQYRRWLKPVSDGTLADPCNSHNAKIESWLAVQCNRSDTAVMTVQKFLCHVCTTAYTSDPTCAQGKPADVAP
jgi:hypothetical protein